MRKLKVRKVNFFDQAHNASWHATLFIFSTSVAHTWDWTSGSTNPTLYHTDGETEAQSREMASQGSQSWSNLDKNPALLTLSLAVILLLDQPRVKMFSFDALIYHNSSLNRWQQHLRMKWSSFPFFKISPHQGSPLKGKLHSHERTVPCGQV